MIRYLIEYALEFLGIMLPVIILSGIILIIISKRIIGIAKIIRIIKNRRTRR